MFFSASENWKNQMAMRKQFNQIRHHRQIPYHTIRPMIHFAFHTIGRQQKCLKEKNSKYYPQNNYYRDTERKN